MGTVRRIENMKKANGDIDRYITFTVVRVLVGEVEGEKLTLRIAGGVVEGEQQAVHGSPKFDENEEVIPFVEGNGRFIVAFVRWGQGVFKIVTGKGQRHVTDDVGNAVLSIAHARVVKEKRIGAEIRILTGANRSVMSGETVGPAKSFPVEPSQDDRVLAAATTMAPEAFVAAISQTVRILPAGKNRKVVRSIAKGARSLDSESFSKNLDATRQENNSSKYTPELGSDEPTLPRRFDRNRAEK